MVPLLTPVQAGEQLSIGTVCQELRDSQRKDPYFRAAIGQTAEILDPAAGRREVEFVDKPPPPIPGAVSGHSSTTSSLRVNRFSCVILTQS